MKAVIGITAIALIAGCASEATREQEMAKQMSFFVTSTGPGRGADLGGLAGADKHCQSLAAAVGAGNKAWRAYLSATPGETAPVNARERIGRGPWYNANGVIIAKNVDDLHANPNINKQTALTEKGGIVNGRGDTPNMHDMLTGSQADGRAFPAGKDMTCSNWRSSGEGAAMLGHHDRIGLRDDDASKSWNSSHPSRACGLEALKATGGNGLFYCFAAN
jgi:hypothetical protein